VACEQCKGVFGRCRAGSWLCKICARLRTIKLHEADDFRFAQQIYKKGLGDPKAKLNRMTSDKYFLLNVIDGLVNGKFKPKQATQQGKETDG
jgi:hypothetical protein